MSKAANDAVQQQMVAARRTQILDAATAVFADKGFHRTTIRDVAAAAGVADGTIYNYFDNKTALLLGIMNRLNDSDHRDADLARINTTDPRQFVRAYVRQRVEALNNPVGQQMIQVILSEVLVNRELRTLFWEQVIEPTFKVAEAHFQQAADRGILRSTDISLTLRAIAGMFLGLQIFQIMGDPGLEARRDALPDLIADLILDGVANSTGDE